MYFFLACEILAWVGYFIYFIVTIIFHETRSLAAGEGACPASSELPARKIMQQGDR